MATAKQLAALKKARAARKKNLSAKKSPVKRKRNPSLRDLYVIEVTAKDGRQGFYAGNGKVDTLRSKAYIYAVHKDAIDTKNLLSHVFKGKVRSLSVKKKT